MNRYHWKYIVTGPKLVLATLTAVIASNRGRLSCSVGWGAFVNALPLFEVLNVFTLRRRVSARALRGDGVFSVRLWPCGSSR